jgi:hypothetical protein
MNLDRTILQLEALRAGWEHGMPVRPNVLDRELHALLDLVPAADATEAARAHELLGRLAATLRAVQTANVEELSALPARRRAVRAHACLQSDSPRRLGVRA